jgi:hypothetical protein
LAEKVAEMRQQEVERSRLMTIAELEQVAAEGLAAAKRLRELTNK